MYTSHNGTTAIELDLIQQASMIVEFGHVNVKYCNGKNTNVDCSNGNIANFLQKGRTNPIASDNEKGERDVKYWGRRHIHLK